MDENTTQDREREMLGIHLRKYKALQGAGLEMRGEEGWEFSGASWEPA